MRSERQLRRAEERRLRKQNRKANPSGFSAHQAATPPLEDERTLASRQVAAAKLADIEAIVEQHLASERQRAANRSNAQLSTGPRSDGGKQRSRLNAQRHGLTGKTTLLRTEDADLYAAYCERMRRAYQPVGDLELILVRKIADTEWRLERVPSAEAAIYAQGRMDYTHLFADYDRELQSDLIDLHTSRQHERELRNLHLQEGRLNRNLEKSKAELRALQHQRKSQEALLLAKKEKTVSKPAPVPENGFVFTTGAPQLAAAAPQPRQTGPLPQEFDPLRA